MKFSRSQHGFTLMEIVVSTTIFATSVTLMLVLFNFTLKINRKVEALRQVSQATRNFTELLVREVRNGSIDYSGTIDSTHCPATYSTSSGATFLAIVNRAGDRECFYLVVDGSGNGTLWMTKQSVSGLSSNEQINATNVTIDPATFRLFVRPLTNPQVALGGFNPGVQPYVIMVMNLTVRLNAIDAQSIPYQTAVSTDSYNILHR